MADSASETEEPMRVAALIRVSTDQQARKGTSHADQISEIERWCSERNMVIVETYGHDDRSGKHKHTSPGFRKMLRDAKTDAWDALVVMSVDRFRRDTTDALDARRALEQGGKKLFVIQFGQSDVAGGSEAELLMFMLSSFTAEAEWNRFRARAKQGHRTKVNSRRWNGGPTPTGYQPTRNPDDSGLTRDPAQETAIERLWAMLLAGEPTHAVARRLNEEGFPPPKASSKSWTQPTVAQIAYNPVYAGRLAKYDKDFKRIPRELGEEADWQPYVTPEQWTKVQRILASRKNQSAASLEPGPHRGGRPSKYFLLARGMARCGYCEEPLWVRKDKHSDYYYCSSAKRGLDVCHMRQPTRDGNFTGIKFDRRAVDLTIRQWITDHDLADVDLALELATENATMQSKQMDRELRRLRKERDETVAGTQAMFGSGTPPKDWQVVWDMRQASLQQLDAKIDNLTEQLADAKAATPDAKVAHATLRAFREQFAIDEKASLTSLQTSLQDAISSSTIFHLATAPEHLKKQVASHSRPARHGMIVVLRWRDEFIERVVEGVDLRFIHIESPLLVAEGVSDTGARGREPTDGKNPQDALPRKSSAPR